MRSPAFSEHDVSSSSAIARNMEAVSGDTWATIWAVRLPISGCPFCLLGFELPFGQRFDLPLPPGRNARDFPLGNGRSSDP